METIDSAVRWSGLWLSRSIFVDARSRPTLMVAVLFSFYIPGMLILGRVWLLSRPRRRPWPGVWHKVVRGVPQMKRCGYDLSFLVAQPTASQTRTLSGVDA